MNKRPTLGQWCTVAGFAYKTHYTADGSDPSYGKRNSKQYPLKTAWEAHSCTPRKAMFIGWRSMPIGVTHMETDTDDFNVWSYPVFYRKGTVEVWMFVTSDRSTPFFAPPYHVEWDATDEPSALDELVHTPQPDDRLDDRHWSLGTGGR